VDGFQLLREAKGSSLLEVLEDHQALIGIILGYGRENSWAFLESCEKRVPVGDVWKGEISKEIQTCRVPVDIHECLALESCPNFAGYPNSEESIALKKAYLLTRDKVINYYKDKDFLEATLSLLAGFRPTDY
jgi:hypothetical protein